MPGFDVVVAGAGSAGCVLASRLSEDQGRSVLLIEAGPDYGRREDLPPEIADGSFPVGSHDWGFVSEPDEVIAHRIDLLRARLTGGCSATNACLALRGSPADYDAWAAAGNRGWAFADVLPAFRACETDLDFGGDEWHGSSGPVPIRRHPAAERSAAPAAALEAASRLGYPAVDDHNRPGAVGAGPVPVNRVDGVRMSTALTYLAMARGRPNLTIRPMTLVDRVAIDRGRATRLLVRRPEGTTDEIEAGVVVLAAGAFGSPSILLRSGVGSSEDLDALGIPVARDVPGVGRNLIDHPWLSVDVPGPSGPPPAPLGQAVITWRSRSAKSGNLPDLPELPDLQMIPCSVVPSDGGASPTGATLFVGVSVLKPASRGRLTLRSPDPTVAPRTAPAYLREPEDVARALEGIRAARELLRTAPLSNLVRGHELRPAPGVADGDLETLAAAVRSSCGTYHHAVGTCRMGVDDGAVVDPTGRVHGVDGLWVCDASVMPDIPSANTNLPTMMIAERMAGWIAERG